MANVKTAPALIEEDYDRATMQRLGGDLPHVFQQRSGQYSYWMFRARGVCIRLKGELGSEEFFQHWHELYQLFGLDAPDERMVYFIGWDNGPIKIGLAGDVTKRLNDLQTACPYRLRVVASCPGGFLKEREYHKVFAEHRLEGEWFERVPEIEAEIAALRAKSGDSKP